MRIADLHLAAYGPFEDVALDVSADGLHLVYGPNEAGKTSALRAIESFFFGIPHNSPDNFRHDYAKLRVGATLIDAEGASLRLFRRKGRTNTLLDADGKAVDEARLAPFLGGLSQDVWRGLFSLTRAEVEQGNADILAGQGHLGEALFSAGLGGAGVSRVLAALQSEAETLYKKSGSKPRINELKAAHDDLKKRLSAAQLSFAEWDAARKAVAEAEAEAARLRDEMKHLQGRERQLDRRILARDAAESRRRALRALLEEGISEALFAKASELAALGRLSGEYRKRRDALPDLQARARDAGAAWQEKVARLFSGHGNDGPPAFSREDEERLKVLARRCLEAERAAVDQRDRVETTEERLRRIGSALERTGVAEEIGPLKALVEEATAAGDLEASIAEGRKRAAKLEKEIASGMASLGLWSGGNADALAALPVPPEATLERFETETSAAREAVAAAEREVTRVETELADRKAERENLAAQTDTPTPEELAGKRAARDAQWLEIHARWQAGEAPSDDPPLARTFPAGLAETDQLADRMIGDSQLVERRIQADRAVLRQESALAEARHALVSTRAASEETSGSWHAEWTPCGLAPRPPREMRPWLRNRAEILEKAARLEEARLTAEEAETKRDRFRARLATALGGEDADFAPLFAAAKSRVTEVTRSEGERRQLKKDSETEKAHLERARQEAARADETLAKAQADWVEVLPRCGFATDTLPEAGLVLADDLSDLSRLDGDRRRATEAAASAGETVATFEKTVLELVEATGLTEDRLAPDAHFETLDAKLQRGQALRQEIATAEARLRDALPESESLAPFAESLLAEDEGTAKAELQTTRDRLTLAEQEHSDAIAKLTDARRALASMNGRDDSARLEEERQNILAEMRGHASRYATLVAARETLRQTVERFREENQGPVLARARTLFRELTLGGFSDLRAGYNDKDEPVLRAVRAADSSEVPVDGLSEGTRDQFYLALRLAGLEHYVAAHGPMPLLVDDILISFDDARSAAVLKVLGELASKIQVILFTHHEHLLALARNALGAGQLHEHRLGAKAS